MQGKHFFTYIPEIINVCEFKETSNVPPVYVYRHCSKCQVNGGSLWKHETAAVILLIVLCFDLMRSLKRAYDQKNMEAFLI